MGLLPHKKKCELRMRQEHRELLPRHRLQRKSLVSDPGMNHDTCVTYVLWLMSGSLTRFGGWNIPGIPGACATRNCKYVVRDPCHSRVFRLASRCYVRFRLFQYSDICVKLLLRGDICCSSLCIVNEFTENDYRKLFPFVWSSRWKI